MIFADEFNPAQLSSSSAGKLFSHWSISPSMFVKNFWLVRYHNHQQLVCFASYNQRKKFKSAKMPQLSQLSVLSLQRRRPRISRRSQSDLFRTMLELPSRGSNETMYFPCLSVSTSISLSFSYSKNDLLWFFLQKTYPQTRTSETRRQEA